jgi:hypothetical protein
MFEAGFSEYAEKTEARENSAFLKYQAHDMPECQWSQRYLFLVSAFGSTPPCFCIVHWPVT